jgi:hypothetical protein
MIEVKSPVLDVSRVVTANVTFYTLSETNFGSVHHVTFTATELEKILKRIDRGVNERPPKQGGRVPGSLIEHGQIWNNWPWRGFVTIWEVSPHLDKRRCIHLTFDQIGELLNHFESAQG